MVAAVVCSLSLAWGIGELCGVRRSLEHEPQRLRWFFLITVAAMVSAAALVLLSSNLLWLGIMAQLVNVFTLPLVVGFLIVLASTGLPDRWQLRGWHLCLTVCVAAATCGCDLLGALQGMFGGG